MDTHENNLKEEILQKIQKGELKMRPKAFFITKVIILLCVALVTFVVSVLVVSYTWFSLRADGHIFLLGFGGRGVYEFFLIFPWLLLLLDVLLILFFEWLLKKFKLGYHNPVLYVFIGSMLVITISGSVVNMTSFHKNIQHMAENKHLPIPGVGGFYANLRHPHPENGLFRGEVISLATSSFIIHDPNATISHNQDTFQIFVPPNFDPMLILQVGDEVFVAGDIESNGFVRAYGIKKLTLED